MIEGRFWLQSRPGVDNMTEECNCGLRSAPARWIDAAPLVFSFRGPKPPDAQEGQWSNRFATKPLV